MHILTLSKCLNIGLYQKAMAGALYRLAGKDG